MEIMTFPVMVTTENGWYVASCPLLHIATQGKSENEVKENIKDLIEEYMSDPDTNKPAIETIKSFSVTMTTVPITMEDNGYAGKTEILAAK